MDDGDGDRSFSFVLSPNHQKRMDDLALLTGDHKIDQFSTDGLPEALWDLDDHNGDLLNPQGHHDYHRSNHLSTSSASYANPSFSSYPAYDPANNIGWKEQPLSSMQEAPPSSSSSPQVLSFDNCNQLATKNEYAGNSGNFIYREGCNFRKPNLCQAVSSNTVAAVSGPPVSRGGNRGEGSGCGSVSRAGTMAGGGKTPAAAQEHIMAERKRREKLSQRFIALSAIVPGLKKTDKASVLGDAIEYMKQLQDRVQSLEKQAAKQTVKSAVLVKKSHVPMESDTASSDDNSNSSSATVMDPSLAEIEVKVMDERVLLRIHCAHRKAILVKILAEVERLQLSVLNSSVMPFTGSVLDITIIAQMEEGFSIPVKNLVTSLHSAITQLL